VVLITYVYQNALLKKLKYFKFAFLFALFVTQKYDDVP